MSSMHYEVEQDISFELNERLRMETGWNDVASGLARVLIGYLVFILGATLGVVLVLASAFKWLTGGSRGAMPSLGSLWLLYIGLGILSVVGTFGYLTIMGGQWRCLHGAAERYGARWLMFFCLTSLFAGPALNSASYIGGVTRGPDLQRGARTFGEMRFNTTGHYMQLASAAASLLYSVFFLLFLRAVARCHGSRRHVMLVNVFLVVAVGLVALSVYVGYLFVKGALPLVGPDPRLVLGGAWLVAFLFYVFLIGSIRSCIIQSLARVKSPLDM